MGEILKDDEILKIEGKNRVLIGGCFDILHPGHFEFIKRAKKEGNILILLLENDENIKRLKGSNHPLNSHLKRAENLLKTSVDYIVLLQTPNSDKYYFELVKSIHPDIIAVTENDPLIEVKRKQAREIGGDLKVVMKRDKRYSSSSILKRHGVKK